MSSQHEAPGLGAIQPPPSVDDLLQLATGARLGQVDFASRLAESDSPPERTAPAPSIRPPAAVSAAVPDPLPAAEPPTEPAPAEPAPAEPQILEHEPVDPRPVAKPVRPAPPEPPPPPGRPPLDPGGLGLTVQEVAEAAIDRIRDVEQATLRRLGALETEAARRAELLTAQAELDAELIRITARREAHAIISAARVQAGAGSLQAPETRELSQISEAVARFAESVESSVAPLRHGAGEDRS